MKHLHTALVQGLFFVALAPLAGAACFSSDDPAAGPPGLPDASADEMTPGDDGSAGPDTSTSPGADAASNPDGTTPIDASTSMTTDADATADVSTVDAALDSLDAGADCVSPAQTTLSAAAEGLPANGIVLWMRADRGVFKTATNDVCAWRDQSGNNVVLTPNSVRPSWGAASIGNLPAVHFAVQGTDMGTSGVLGIDPAGARTFVAVEQLVSTTGRFHPILQGESGSPDVYVGIDANTWETAGSREGVYVPGNSIDATFSTATTPRVHVLTMGTMAEGTAITDAIDYRINGATQSLTVVDGSGALKSFSTANFTVVGSVSQTTTQTYGDAMVAEALIYNRALTDNEKQAVEAALEARYSILPAMGDN
jgi:hypothetical protein